MIALGVLGKSGLESEDIDTTIKNKILRLVSEKMDKCEFDFQIKSSEGTNLEARLVDKEVSTFLNKQKVGKDKIRENFKILFDVPSDPIKKLNSALKSIKTNLDEYETYVQNYNYGIKNTIETISEYENRKTKLSEQRKILKQKSDTLKELRSRLKKVQEEFSDTKKIFIVRSYFKYAEEISEFGKEKERLDKDIKKMKSAGIFGGNNEYIRKINAFMSSLDTVKISINTSNNLLSYLKSKEKKDFEKIRKQIKSIGHFTELKDDDIKQWYNYFDGLRKKIEKEPEMNSENPDEQRLQVIEKLISTLKDFINVTGILPGTQGKTVIQFINDLEDGKKELQKGLYNKLALRSTLEDCNNILRNFSKLAEARIEIPKISKESKDDPGIILQRRKELDSKINDLGKKLAKIESEFQSIEETERQKILRLNLFVDEKIYNEKQNELESIKKNIDDHEIEVNSKKSFIEQIEKIEKPTSMESETKLKELYSLTSNLLRKISRWKEYLESINLEKVNVELIDESKKFYDSVAVYLAKILKFIYFENKPWEVQKVDFLNQFYVVKGRQPIDFVDFGTGHNELNAFMARLKQNYGKRKKIVLFDEYGVMDIDNFNRLISEIKNQIKTGEVFFALLTRSDDNLKDVVMEPVRM